VSHPDALPELFLDRSLGRIKVPQLLRAVGLRLTTLAEHYGVPADERVADADWLAVAGRRGWVVFMKDTRIRYKPAEKAAVRNHAVRCFCLTHQGLPADEMAHRFVTNLPAITAACAVPGPFIYAVHAYRIQAMPLGG